MKKQLNWLFDYPNLKVYQYEEGFKFSLDSILLAEFVTIRKNDKNIIDLCTGNAVIPILLNHKYQKKIYGVEIQKEIYDLGLDSIKENKMDKSISLINDSVLNLKNYFPGNNFDVVVSNPPYFKVHNEEFLNKNTLKRMARHEITLTLEQLMAEASFLLKTKGRFYLVHVPSRIDEIFLLANKYHMAVKKIQFVYSDIHLKPIIVLVCLVKDGKNGVKVFPPVSILNAKTYQGIFLKEDQG